VARRLPLLTLASVAAVFVAGAVLRAADVELGTPLAPWLFDVDVHASAPWVALAAAVLAVGTALAPPLLRARALGPLAFAAVLLGAALAVRLAVGAMDYGPEGWDDVFNESFEAKNEYLVALPALEDGVRFFLDRFADLVPALPPHAAGHPPGTLVVLHALGITTPAGATGFFVVAGALSVPLTYALGRRLLDEPRARTAGILAVFAPATVLYGVTSADAAFATLGAAAAVLLLAAPRVAATAGAATLAVASFFSYALLALGAWPVLVRLQREGVRPAVAVAAACAAALALFYAVLFAATGFDIAATLQATSEVYDASVARLRPYAFWVFGSPAAFLAFLGLPITWYAARAAGERDPAAVALVVVIAISAVAGFTKAETERIWLMYVPLACVAAAAVLPPGRVALVLGLLSMQAFMVELICGTVW
jgi:hypothetical protein